MNSTRALPVNGRKVCNSFRIVIGFMLNSEISHFMKEYYAMIKHSEGMSYHFNME